MSLRKEKFYSLVARKGKRVVEKHEGYADNKWQYYKGREDGDGRYIWYAIDPMTGLALCSGDTRADVVDKANDEKTIQKFNKLTETDVYTTMVNIWYHAQVDAGLIMENPIH